MLVLVLFAYLENAKGFYKLVPLSEYASPVIVVLSFLIFLFVKKQDVVLKKIYICPLWGVIIKHLSDNSFGIYVFHMLWVNILYKVALLSTKNRK